MRKVFKLIFLLIGMIILISFGILLYKEIKPKKPEIETLKKEDRETYFEETKPETETTKTSETITTSSQEATTTKANLKTPNLLIDTIILYPKVDYPFIYGYDPTNKVIKAYNLEDKTYKEILKKENIKGLSFSENNLLALIKDENYWLLDIFKDKLNRLPLNVKNSFWVNNDLYLFISSPEANYLAKFDNNNLKKITDIYILNPVFDYLEDGIVYYENLKNTNFSPLYFIKNYKEKIQILEPKTNLSAISNKKDLIYVSYYENGWKSYIINKDGQKIIEFNFGTLKEKCTFKDLLICGVPKNQDFSNLEDWYYYKKIFSDKLVIFDPKNLDLKYYDIEGNFDIVNPTLTPIGVIFFNRNDAKLYVIPIK